MKRLPLPPPILASLTDRQLRQLAAEADAERCRRYPPNEVRGVPVRTAIPAGGVMLHVDLPDDGLRTEDWFPTLAVAKMALDLFAEELGLKVPNDGFSLDLTAPGGTLSKAWLEEREPIPTTGEKR